VFDARSGEQLAEATGLLRPSGLALAGGRRRPNGESHVYVAETAANRLLILDGRTAEQRGEIKMSLAPHTIAASADGQRLYVALAGSGDVALVDVERAEITKRTPLGGLGLPQDLAVDDGTGRVYVLYLLAPRYRNVAILDGQSGEQVGIISASLEHPLDGAHALAVDAGRQRLYISDAAGLQIYSTTTLKWLATLPTEGSTNAFGLAVDAQRGYVYAALPGNQRQLAVFP
jgi:DNA-binding beta-propeller fold protein YncE